MNPSRDKWQASDVAAHYARTRFRNERARGRDLRMVETLLARHGASKPSERLLDLPCGTGRLTPGLRRHARTYVGADVSLPMLREVKASVVRADAAAQPFGDGSFDVVVCCRLLHHLDAGAELQGVIDELLRVSRGLVIASFWSSASLPAWRRRSGLRRDDTGRRAHSAKRIEACVAQAGGELLSYAHSFRWLSMQTFFAARTATTS